MALSGQLGNASWQGSTRLINCLEVDAFKEGVVYQLLKVVTPDALTGVLNQELADQILCLGTDVLSFREGVLALNDFLESALLRFCHERGLILPRVHLPENYA